MRLDFYQWIVLRMLYVASEFLCVQKQYTHLSPLLFLVVTGAITFFTSFISVPDCIEQFNWKKIICSIEETRQMTRYIWQLC